MKERSVSRMQGESGSAVRYDGTDGDRVHSREMPGDFLKPVIKSLCGGRGPVSPDPDEQ